MFGLAAVVWLGATAGAAQVGPASGAPATQDALAWDWSRPHRYYLETEVRLPYLMWFAKRFNEQARVTAFDIRMVTECTPVDTFRGRAEVMCKIEDVSLRASGLPHEVGLLQPVLEEMDERLSESSVQLVIRDDGRITNIDIEGLDRRNQRVGKVNENLRLVVSRAFAGLDLPLPRVEGDRQWVQTDSWIMKAPASQGSVGTANLVHQRSMDDDRIVEITTAGRGIIVPAQSGNQYDSRLEGRATFDRGAGRLVDRTWTMIGAPTPSSAIAEATEGYPYVQIGRIMALPTGETVDVGATEELEPLTGPSALQQWQFLGLVPQ